MKDLNVKQKTMKIPHENTDSHLFGLGHSNFSLDTSLEAWETKAKMNYWDFIKIRSFCSVKETINKTKRQPMDREKTFANDILDKGLISTIYKELNTHTRNNGEKTRIDIFPKKTSSWPTDTGKDAQHHSSSGKYK